MGQVIHHFLSTGQRTCHDTRGHERDCRGTGQDAEFRHGIHWPEPRFALLDETVHDRLTGLVWTRNASLAEFPLTWNEALAFVSTMNTQAVFGERDWRLPNRRELRSLVSHQTRRPALPDSHPFENVFHGWYWTSTSAAISPAHAWYVDLGGGRLFYGGKDQSFMVWPVRGAGTAVLPRTGQGRCFDAAGREIACRGTGQDGELRLGNDWPAPRFAPTDQGVADRLTGLIWHPAADATNAPVAWQAALDAVATLNAGGDRDWRLPNINELDSLVDAEAFNPALPAGHPFRKVRDVYWSSTTSLYETDWAWALYLDKGAVGVGQKRDAHFYAWAVRG